MNPFDAIAKIFGAEVSRPGELLWAMEEQALAAYHVRARSESNRVTANYVRHSGRGGTEGRVAIIPIHGVMVQEPQWDDETSTVAIARLVREAAANESISAIVLSMDTPGGSVAGLKQLGDAVDAAMAAKSVVSQVETMCCSAGYEIACHTGKIFASRDSLVGSIGTRLHVFDWSAFCANLGIKSVPIDTGEFKSTGAWGTELTENQRAYLQEIVDDFQVHFSSTVQRGRAMSDTELAAVATGRVWTGERAVGIKLIDGVHGLADTLSPFEMSATPTRSNAMADTANSTAEPQGPKAATLAELKAAMPEASSDFLISQLEKGATEIAAVKAYNSHLAEQLKAAAEDKAKAVAEAEKAAKAGQSTTTTTKRGNAPGASADAGDGAVDMDYRQMARAMAKERGISYGQAARLIQKEHGTEARDAFKMGVLPG
jgi:signal peptide peptidase SppA